MMTIGCRKGETKMKKMMKLFGLIALSAVAFSCSKEVSQDITAPEGNGPEEQTAPATEKPVADGNVLTSFSVTFENDAAGAKTKVSVDLGSGETDIEEGDLVLVVSGSSSATYQYDGEKFVPETEGGEITIDAYAGAGVYYPAGEFELNTTNSQVVFTMPSAIVAGGDFGAINPMVGQITGSAGAYTVQLCNIASVLKVHVDADVSIQSVTLDYGSMVNYAAGSKWFVDAGQKSLARSEGSDDSEETVSVSGTSADVVFILPTVELGELKVTANLASAHNGGSNDFSVSRGGFTPTRNSISTMSFYAGLFSGGAGTSGNPYKIANARDFKNFQKYTVEGYGSMTASSFLSAHYQQIADIDFKNASLTPIGSSVTAAFLGIYDGGGKMLQNVKIDVNTQFAALFGYVKDNSVIKDLTVTGSIQSTTTESNSLSGSIAGILNGNARVERCINEASISSSATYTGGIVGRLYGGGSSISECVNKGTVSSSTNNAGGIVGQLANNNGSGGIIFTCCNLAAVGGANQVGGIAGSVNNGKVYACQNHGNITAKATEAGGIAGQVRGGVITTCFSSGAVTITGTSRLGGIAGYQENRGSGTGSLIINCAAKSRVYSTGDGNNGAAGGLVGNMYSEADKGDVILANSVALKNCIYNFRSVSETWNDSKLGGVVGRVNGSLCYVRNCYSHHDGSSTGAIYCSKNRDGSTLDKTKQTNMGGIYGALEVGTVQNCYCMGNVATGAGITATNTLVGAGNKSSGTTTGNTRVFTEAIMNGAQTITFTNNNIAGNGITLASISPATLLDLMNAGTWTSSAKTERTKYTISGIEESFSEWEAIILGSFPYPKFLKENSIMP